jgi:hypothetical protein
MSSREHARRAKSPHLVEELKQRGELRDSIRMVEVRDTLRIKGDTVSITVPFLKKDTVYVDSSGRAKVTIDTRGNQVRITSECKTDTLYITKEIPCIDRIIEVKPVWYSDQNFYIGAFVGLILAIILLSLWIAIKHKQGNGNV